MRGQLIGFAGYAKSGKNLAADLIREKDYSWEIVSFAGRLKQISSLLTGLDVRIFENKKDLYLHGWGMTIREFLQKLGTDAIRNHFHEDTWVNALLSDYHQSDKWLITRAEDFLMKPMLLSNMAERLLGLTVMGSSQLGGIHLRLLLTTISLTML